MVTTHLCKNTLCNIHIQDMHFEGMMGELGKGAVALRDISMVL